jgi:hypothetical protein
MHPIASTATVHIEKILSFFSDESDAYLVRLAQTCKAMHARLAPLYRLRLQTLQWWPLRLEGSTFEEKEAQLRTFGLHTWFGVSHAWVVTLRLLHKRLAHVTLSPSAFDASFQARIRPNRMVRRQVAPGEKPDLHGWTSEECSDSEANDEK